MQKPLLMDLQEKKSLSLSYNSNNLFGGCSLGGKGVLWSFGILKNMLYSLSYKVIWGFRITWRLGCYFFHWRSLLCSSLLAGTLNHSFTPVSIIFLLSFQSIRCWHLIYWEMATHKSQCQKHWKEIECKCSLSNLISHQIPFWYHYQRKSVLISFVPLEFSLFSLMIWRSW